MTTIGNIFSILSLFYFLTVVVDGDHVYRDCVRPYKQNGLDVNEFGVRNFSSPFYPLHYPPNLECIYQFIADPGYRVQLMFDDFALGGNAPKCDHFIDLYTEVDGNFNFPNEQLSGRFCGSVSPGLRISLHNVAVIVFHARGDKGEKGFHGRFQFLDGKKYNLRVSGNNCGTRINGSKHGSIFSPTYPGKYPSNLVCTYKLNGHRGQRIRLFFKDFDLYFGGPHCPYDAVTLYDGDSTRAVIINKICGLQQTLEVFSESENMFIEFKTVDAPYAEHRGFEIEYTFSKKFVDLKKMKNNDHGIQHIRGTECDVRVISNGESEHLIRSPNYPDPYPRNTTCTYILDGMQGPKKLEQVYVEFQSFSVQSDFPDCTDANVTLFRNVQDVKETKSDNTPDEKFCTPGAPPPLFKSLVGTSAGPGNGPRMVLLFRSNNNVDHGFQAKVSFRTDFGIPGEKKNDSNNVEMCHFQMKYDASIDPTDKSGNFFNSPRFPDDYLANSTCRYDMVAPKNNIVLIYFEQFSLHGGISAADRGGDRLELYNNFDNGTRHLYGNYTSEWPHAVPGPVLSLSNNVTVEFISDAHYMNTGFKAYYKYLDRSKLTECDYLIKGEIGGVFNSSGYNPDGASGKYPKDHICHWEIRVRPGYRVLLQPMQLNVEGQMSEDGLFGQCQYAVIRVYNDSRVTGKEFCGDILKNPGVRQFVSEGDVLHVRFITSPEKVLELNGFKFSWTEFQDDPQCKHPDLFQCAYTKYCIHKDLKCDGAPNCGDFDQSDEDKVICATVDSGFGKTAILAGCGVGLVLLLVLIIGCIMIRRRLINRSTKSNDRYPSIQRRPLNTSRPGHHDADLC